jgi:hypothetical protein
MINELEVFKSIVSDLTGASVWLMALYVVTKAMVVAGWVFLGNKLINAGVSIFTRDISVDEAKIYKDKCHELEGKIKDVESDCKHEVEEYKHMYKLLKQAKDNE